jgi:hypothetical protein
VILDDVLTTFFYSINCLAIFISFNLCATMMRNFPRQEIRNHDSPKITHHGYRCTKKIYPVWGIFYFSFIPRLGIKASWLSAVKFYHGCTQVNLKMKEALAEI